MGDIKRISSIRQAHFYFRNMRFRQVVFILFILSLACSFALARITVPNSDSVQNFNELNSVFSGNVLLSHWVLASDSFYLTDLPFYVLGRALFGNELWLIYAVPFVVYGLLLAISLYLLWRAGAPRLGQAALALLFLIGVPFAPDQFMFLVSAFHTATVLFTLVALAAITPVLTEGRSHVSRYLVFATALFIACASDPMADFFFVAPLLLFLPLEAWRRRVLPPAYLVVAGCACVVLISAHRFPDLIWRAHGFATRLSYSDALAIDPAAIMRNFGAVVTALGVLFGARDLSVIPFATVVSIIRAGAFVWVLLSAVTVFARPSAGSFQGVARFLVLAACCLLGADCLSFAFTSAIKLGPGYPGPAVRYVAPAFLFLCIGAALAPAPLPAPLLVRRAFMGVAWFSGAFVFVAVTALSLKSLSQPPGLQGPQAYELVRWLRARHLTYGVGDYYTTQLVRALSRAQVMADPMTVSDGRLQPDRFWTDTTRFDAKIRPQFVVFPPGNWFGITEADAVATYGPPVAVTSVHGVKTLLYVPGGAVGKP
ncbi:MAG TPA: hypothetical protein VGH03_11485 [Caulobacteraceae bacterium]